MAAEHVLHMQKALDQMNLQIHRVPNDLTGMSGLRILEAILAGERDPLTLAGLCHGGAKCSEDKIAKSLEGDYRPEHLFALRQSLAAPRRSAPPARIASSSYLHRRASRVDNLS